MGTLTGEQHGKDEALVQAQISNCIVLFLYDAFLMKVSGKIARRLEAQRQPQSNPEQEVLMKAGMGYDKNSSPRQHEKSQ